MSRITDPEGPFASTMTKVANLALINIWFIICSLPVFTIGAAFTALMDIAWKMTLGTEGTAITKAYFRSFKDNFRKSTAIWLIQIPLFLILAADFFIGIRSGLKGGMTVAFFAIFLIGLMIVLFTTWYSLTMQAIFDNTVGNMIKNGLMISFARFPYTLGIAVCLLSPGILLLMSPRKAYFFLPLLAIIWFGAAAYGAAFIFRKALMPFLPEGYGDEIEEKEDDDMEEALSRLDEIWDIYDKDKRPTGRTMKRNDWNMADGDYHLSVLGVLVRPDGKYLITKRKMDKEWAPGSYEVPGGGVRAGESSACAVRREVLEETGIDVKNALDGGFAFDYRRDNPEEKNNYFVDVYKYTIEMEDKDIHLQEDETEGYMFADSEEIGKLGEEGKFLHYGSIKKALQ